MPIDCTMYGDTNAICVYSNHCLCSIDEGFVCDGSPGEEALAECAPGKSCKKAEYYFGSSAASCGSPDQGLTPVDCTQFGDTNAYCVYSNHCACSTGEGFYCQTPFWGGGPDPCEGSQSCECQAGSVCVKKDAVPDDYGTSPTSCGGSDPQSATKPVDCTQHGDKNAFCVYGDHCACSSDEGFICEKNYGGITAADCGSNGYCECASGSTCISAPEPDECANELTGMCEGLSYEAQCSPGKLCGTQGLDMDSDCDGAFDACLPCPEGTQATDTDQDGCYDSCKCGKAESNICEGSPYIQTAADLEPWFGCTQITGTLMVINSDLSGFAGLESLESVGGLFIQMNAELIDLSGLTNLTTIQGEVMILDNPKLKTLSGLSSLKTIAGNTWIKGNTALENLVGLSLITELPGSLTLQQNHALSNMQGLESLQSIAADFKVLDEKGLLNFIGLDALQTVGGHCVIQGTTSLTSLQGLGALENVAGDLSITETAALKDLIGLASLTTVGGWLSIRENSDLENLVGAAKLKSIGVSLKIADNPKLLSLSGLEALNSVGAHLWVENNAVLVDLLGLHNMEVGGSVTVSDNPELINLEGLTMMHIVGYLHISNNDKLSNLIGLVTLETVSGTLYIAHNDGLLTLQGIETLMSVGTLSIKYNSVFPTCAALAFKEAITINGVGSATIEGNDDTASCD